MHTAAIENAARLAWPALEEKEMNFGILRFAKGVSRRSNSMNLYLGAEYENEEIAKSTEAFFAERDKPAIVRVLGSAAYPHSRDAELDSYLSTRAYAVDAPTKVLGMNLVDISCVEPCPIDELKVEDWSLLWHRFAGHHRAQCSVHVEILKKIRGKAVFAVANDAEGRVVCTAMAVITDGLMGLYGVATHPQYRGRGYSNNLLCSLLQWGKNNHAVYAYLQVEATNKSALGLYTKLGFSEQYNYWYRVKARERVAL